MSNEKSLSASSQPTREELQQRVAALEATVAHLQAEREAQTVPMQPDATIPYDQLIEHLPIPLTMFRTDGLLVAMNRQNEHLLGIPRDQAIGRYNVLADQEAITQGYAASVQRALAGAVDRMPVRAFHVHQTDVAKHLVKHTIWTETIHFPLYDATGTVQYVVAVNLDVSKHVETTRRLQHSENRFRTIIENVPSGICITNPQGMFEYVNPAYCRIYGYREAELLGEPFTIVVPADYRDQAQQLHDIFLAERKEIPADWVVINKAGESLHILASAAYLEEPDGGARKVTFVLDITDRKHAEAQQTLLQQQIIDTQQARLRELSTPLIPITDEVVIMPLIGSIDDQRAQQILEALLEGVARHQATMVILDITGVEMINEQVANTLMQAASAVQLLGTQLMITGIQPKIAQTLVTLGIDLGHIDTRSTLQAGIAAALNQGGLAEATAPRASLRR